jgi:hypothetical protein
MRDAIVEHRIDNTLFLSRHYDRRAATAQLRQIAVRGHADLQAWSFPANNRTIEIRQQQRALQLPSSRTSAVA